MIAQTTSQDQGAMSDCHAAERCMTCADEAIAMRVLEVDHERGLALCGEPQGEHSSVETALVESVVIGDVLLVHAGTALARATGERQGL